MALTHEEQEELRQAIREETGDLVGPFVRVVAGAAGPAPQVRPLVPAMTAPQVRPLVPAMTAPQVRPLVPARVPTASEGTTTPAFIFVMAFTAPHFEEALNVVLSLQRAGVWGGAKGDAGGGVRIEIHSDLAPEQERRLGSAAMGGAAFRKLSVGRVDVASSSADWGKFGFSLIVQGKFVALRDALDRYPRSHLVWLDTDLYFFRDPRPALLAHAARYPRAAAHFQQSSGKACTGFFLICTGAGRAAARGMLDRAERLLAEHVRRGPTAKYRGDESCINEVIRRDRVPVTYLQRALFPNGRDYFGHNMRRHAILVHNNFIRGLDKKIARFKAHGLWLVGPAPAALGRPVTPRRIPTPSPLPGTVFVAAPPTSRQEGSTHAQHSALLLGLLRARAASRRGASWRGRSGRGFAQ
jgi:hypothetical protein